MARSTTATKPSPLCLVPVTAILLAEISSQICYDVHHVDFTGCLHWNPFAMIHFQLSVLIVSFVNNCKCILIRKIFIAKIYLQCVQNALCNMNIFFTLWCSTDAQDRAQSYHDEGAQKTLSDLNLKHAEFSRPDANKELRLHDPNIHVDSEAHVAHSRALLNVNERDSRNKHKKDRPLITKHLSDLEATEGKPVRWASIVIQTERLSFFYISILLEKSGTL